MSWRRGCVMVAMSSIRSGAAGRLVTRDMPLNHTALLSILSYEASHSELQDRRAFRRRRPPPALARGFVLVRNHFSLISAGTERSTVTTAQASLLGKARQRPDLVKQVLDSFRKDGLADTLDQSPHQARDAEGTGLQLGRDGPGLLGYSGTLQAWRPRSVRRRRLRVARGRRDGAAEPGREGAGGRGPGRGRVHHPRRHRDAGCAAGQSASRRVRVCDRSGSSRPDYRADPAGQRVPGLRCGHRGVRRRPGRRDQLPRCAHPFGCGTGICPGRLHGRPRLRRGDHHRGLAIVGSRGIGHRCPAAEGRPRHRGSRADERPAGTALLQEGTGTQDLRVPTGQDATIPPTRRKARTIRTDMCGGPRTGTWRPSSGCSRTEPWMSSRS